MRTQIAAVSAARGVGFGKAAVGSTHPAVFIIGTVGGQYGFFRSDDGAGAAWTRINDDTHQYGWLQNNYVAGGENVFGRVYLPRAAAATSTVTRCSRAVPDCEQRGSGSAPGARAALAYVVAATGWRRQAGDSVVASTRRRIAPHEF